MEDGGYDSFMAAYFGAADIYGDEDSDDQDCSGCYTRHEIEREVTFLRPKYNEETDEFDSEGKDVGWCISNGFEEVEDEVWSGPWYWRHRGGEVARQERLTRNKQQREKAKLRRDELEASCIQRVDEETFAIILHLKERGNAAFQKGNYTSAVTYYLQTSKLDWNFAEGCFLAGEQKQEKVKILSNQAECFLRLKMYEQAQMSAAEALALDKRHKKSLIRRAKATYYGNVLRGDSISSIEPFSAAMAQKDLEKVIRIGGAGVEDAQKLLDEINAVVEEDVNQLRSKGLLDPSDM